MPWRLLKSQYWQESRLDPSAVSPAGARGIAQFMGPTWAEVSRAMGWGLVSPHDVRYAIEAGAYYDSRLYRQWRAPRPETDRISLMLASYNAGLGSILNAQRRCNGAPLYAEIIACLPQVTGRHSSETIGYV
ncbi:MAG TPA: transglycosylase SLT domain-containing protein, partial [Hyphomicrobiaceae bacterium]